MSSRITSYNVCYTKLLRLSLLICALILVSALRLLREALHILMEGVPAHLELAAVGRAMAAEEGVHSVHDLHVWTLSSGHVAVITSYSIHYTKLYDRHAAVETAARQLDYATLESPADGVVSVRMAEPGEVVPAGQPVLRITRLAHPWVRAYLAEPDLARVQLGMAADVHVDGLAGQTLKGRLTYISPEAEFTPKTVETRELRA